ncbi:DUF2510 domain-containing protein [Subtercola boreus]|uniref:DUF2510 domain-containing protein n=1 Tax=Subtercola boreus TaxID=120213 RepID=UPI00155950B6|nr:DUF2510 domain-containing protein [Subtercola boreus]
MSDPLDNSVSPSLAAPGWYPTAPGSPTFRWWDGVQWTEHLQNLSQLTPQPTSTVTKATPVYNVFIWLFVLPLLSVIALLFVDFGSLMADSMRQSLANRGTSNPFSNPTMTSPVYLLVQGLSWVIFAASVVLAAFDFKRLGQVGFARRFHWAWAFLGIF